MKRSQAALFSILLAACGPTVTDAGAGSAQVFLEPEDNIQSGMAPGTEPGTISDGWTIRYEKFIVAFGNFVATQSGNPGKELRMDEVRVVSFLDVPAGGLVVAEFDGAEATQWDKVSYEVPNTPANAVRAEGISDEDFEDMKSGGYSAIISGTASKPGGMSCLPSDPGDCVAREQVRFTWKVRFGQHYGDCGPEQGDSGFSVPSGGTVQLKPTFHGDHWFLSNYASHSAALYAQWIADSDLNRDGETSLEELAMVQASDAFPSPRYNLSAAPGTINTVLDYLEAGLRTMGHFQGEGECNTRRNL